MEAIQRELSNSVKVLLEKIASALSFHSCMSSSLSLLKKMEKTLVDLQDLLYYANYKLNPSQASNISLDLLTRAVSQVAFLLHQTDFFRYVTELTDNQLQIHSRLSFLIATIKSKTENLIQILKGSSSVGDDEYCIYGREADIERVKHLLLSSSDGDSKIKVISIVGMGGIGKTALAKHLYNHPQVTAKFEFKLWADFSTHVDHLSVYETILQSTTSQTTIYANFLLVLDGVWDARSVNWALLMDIFNAWETQSRVIVTTRDERLALSMKTFLSLHYLGPLEVEYCRFLLGKHAFGIHNYQQQSYLEGFDTFKNEIQEQIVRRIAKKCYGLPLAAVELGTLLHISLSPYHWNYALESHVQETTYEVLASLKLSYNFLSDPLKRCFQFCSIFPNKSILEKKMVVQLWVAAGLLESSSSTNQEELGEEYFDELVSRSLIHRRSIGDEERNFGMHNFIHDLATEVSSSYCINLDKHNLDYRVLEI